MLSNSLKYQAEEDLKSAKTEVDVSEQEMASHYSTTVGATVGRKFATKRSFATQPTMKPNVPVKDNLKLKFQSLKFYLSKNFINGVDLMIFCNLW